MIMLSLNHLYISSLRNLLYPTRPCQLWIMPRVSIQLFRERLSEKVHATISKGIVGGFEFTVLQRKLI